MTKVRYILVHDWVEDGVPGGGEYSGTIERDSYKEICEIYKDYEQDKEYTVTSINLCAEVTIPPYQDCDSCPYNDNDICKGMSCSIEEIVK